MEKNYKIEACVESFEEAHLAEQRGADQIELCARLDLDGLTPDRTLITRCINELELAVKVMIRPRGGDFTYDEVELEQMREDIQFCKEIGVHGVVFGILSGQSLNIEETTSLAQMAQPLPVTIHKAIDLTANILEETNRLLSIHELIDTILTSGGAKTAAEGAPKLKEMIRLCKGKINIMPAGKVTNDNIDSLHAELNTSAYHGRKIVGDLSYSSNR